MRRMFSSRLKSTKGCTCDPAAGIGDDFADRQAGRGNTTLPRCHQPVADLEVAVARQIKEFRQIRVAPGQHRLIAAAFGHHRHAALMSVISRMRAERSPTSSTRPARPAPVMAAWPLATPAFAAAQHDQRADKARRRIGDNAGGDEADLRSRLEIQQARADWRSRPAVHGQRVAIPSACRSAACRASFSALSAK